MITNVEITENQTKATITMTLVVEFVEGSDCDDCVALEILACVLLPCRPTRRSDGKKGRFREVTT